jgi:hypothetical protein
LNVGCSESNYAIIGYELIKTLSDHGTVNRGVCALNNDGNLASVTERINISKQGDKIICEDGLEPKEIALNTKVSMNFWCFHPSYFDYTKQMFAQFLSAHGHELKSEFLFLWLPMNLLRKPARCRLFLPVHLGLALPIKKMHPL